MNLKSIFVILFVTSFILSCRSAKMPSSGTSKKIRIFEPNDGFKANKPVLHKQKQLRFSKRKKRKN